MVVVGGEGFSCGGVWRWWRYVKWHEIEVTGTGDGHSGNIGSSYVFKGEKKKKEGKKKKKKKGEE